MIAWIALAAAAPADLAPGAPELLAAQARLTELLATTRAVSGAAGRLQVAWTGYPTPKPTADPCGDAARIELGWRVERFGAAWREAAQAARAQADRVERTRNAPTVAPLVDARWAAQLDALLAEEARQARAFQEASAWQVAYVRPWLGACPVPPLAPAAGIPMIEVPVRTEPAPAVAVLAMGDGWICPVGARGDDAVVLVPDGKACWSATQACGCTPEPVAPGAVLGLEVEAEAPPEEQKSK